MSIFTAELVNMITAQRTYQANAQTVKTQDQIPDVGEPALMTGAKPWTA